MNLCSYKKVWTDEVGDTDVCQIHGENSRWSADKGEHRPCLKLDPYPRELDREDVENLLGWSLTDYQWDYMRRFGNHASVKSIPQAQWESANPPLSRPPEFETEDIYGNRVASGLLLLLGVVLVLTLFVVYLVLL